MSDVVQPGRQRGSPWALALACIAGVAASTSMPVAARAQAAPEPPQQPVPEPEPTAPEPSPQPVTETEVQVRAPPRPHVDTGQTTVLAEEGRLVPGTQGDTLKVIENLPGVARAAYGSGQLVLWGSAPADTRVYVDGVEIPALYHLGGLRSVMSTDLVRTIDLVPGAYGAAYGRGLGGLVRVQTATLDEDGVHGSVGADTLDLSGVMRAAFGENVRVAAAGRYGWVDRLAEALVDDDVRDHYAIPRYLDYQIKATAPLRAGEELSLLLLHASDDLRRAVPSADPAAVRSEVTDTAFHRLALRYTRLDDAGASVTVTPFVGRDTGSVETTFGEVRTRLATRAWKYGLRMDYRTRLGGDGPATHGDDDAAPESGERRERGGPRATLAAGLDVAGAVTDVERAGSATLPAREGDLRLFGGPPGSEVNADAWRTHQLDAAPHVTVDIDVGPFTFSPGLRLDAFLTETSRQTPKVGRTPEIGRSELELALEPRLAVRYRALPRLSYEVSGGLYHQAPAPEDLSAVFGNPTLGLARAIHVGAGQTLKITETTRLELTGYYKFLDEIVARSRLLAPPLARALNQNGEGRAYGAQLLLRQRLWNGFFGWASYALSRAERKYDVDTTWRLFDFDQPQVLTLVASQQWRRWTLGARFRYATGMPRTPVVGAYYDTQSDLYQPIFGRQNEDRLPDFWQLDLRLERAQPIGSVTLRIYLDVQNVTAHENAEEIAYSYDFGEIDHVTGIPTLAIAGARLEL